MKMKITIGEAIKMAGLKEVIKQELLYWPKAFWLLATQGGWTTYTKTQLFVLILKRQCRLHWLRN
jgi:hypothetical protein